MWKPEIGKYGKTASGHKVGPMRFEHFAKADVDSYAFDFDSEAPEFSAYPPAILHAFWAEDGKCDEGGEYDLIAEWTDEPDLTAITTPFGLLDEATQAALKAHGGPYEFWSSRTSTWLEPEAGLARWFNADVYRVKPGSPAPQPETLADRLQRLVTDGMKTPGNEGATLLAALDLWAAERGVTIKGE